MGRNKKQPRLPAGFNETISKQPRVGYSPESFDAMHPVWQLSKLDYDWDHSWDKIGKDRWIEIVLPALRNLETMTWNAIKAAAGGKKHGTNSHNISIDSLSKEAQKRLESLGHIDIDELFSLRLSGKIRIFGIKNQNILRIIWFDFDHAICPMADR